MPGFVGHTVANAAVLVGTSVVMRTQGWSWQDVVAVDAGIAVASLVLSPDMDLFNSKSMDDWGLLRVFWWPYSKLAKHRDRLHIPILGTAVRWLYVAAILLLFTALFRFWFRRIGLSVSFDFAGDTEDIIYNALYLADVFLGAVLADTTHYILDITTTGIKRALPHRYHERYDRYVQDHHDHHHRATSERAWISEEGHQ
jgi:uncharacterized metal-binding protein